MKVYRYGSFSNLLGDNCYAIQKDTWIGWITSYKFYRKSALMQAVNKLKEQGHVVYEM